MAEVVRRIFPGKQNPGDSAAASRKLVDLVATIDPPISGVTVYFKLWDVDDPFDQLHGPNAVDPNPATPENEGMIPNVDLIDGNSDGPDNRPDPEIIDVITGETNEYGKAIITREVSMQPGNNYRAAATCIDDVVDPPAPDQVQVTQADADALSVKYAADGTPQRNGDFSGYQCPVVWSEMLTVWRRLHVDLDSMGPGSDPSTLANRNLDDTGLENTHQGPSGGHSWAEINGWSVPQNGRLEGGTLTVTGGATYTIVDCVDDIGDDSVYVEGSILADENKPASATDDDAPWNPRKADISLMNAKFRPAYIEIKEHPEESQLDIPFVANLSDEAVPVVNATAPGRSPAFVTTPDFWAVQIVTCYQGINEADHDPDDIYHFWTGTDFHRAVNVGELGVLYGQTVPSSFTGYDNVSVILVESIGDRAAWSQIFGPPPFNETPLLNAGDVGRITVVHEVGHVFGIPSEPHPPSGLMKESVQDPSLEFRAEDILTIRSSSTVGEP